MDFSKIKTVHFIGIGGIGSPPCADVSRRKESERVGYGESEVTKELQDGGCCNVSLKKGTKD